MRSQLLCPLYQRPPSVLASQPLCAALPVMLVFFQEHLRLPAPCILEAVLTLVLIFPREELCIESCRAGPGETLQTGAEESQGSSKPQGCSQSAQASTGRACQHYGFLSAAQESNPFSDPCPTSRVAGVHCVTVPGYSKGFGYQTGQSFSGEFDHAWNAVYLEGRWHLVDSTWGSGLVDTTTSKFTFL